MRGVADTGPRQILNVLGDQYDDAPPGQEPRPSIPGGMSWQEKLERWGEYEERQPCPGEDLESNADSEGWIVGDHNDTEFSEVAKYREILAESPSFEWLTSRIRLEKTCASGRRADTSELIRTVILDKLGRFSYISRRMDLVHKKVGFRINWNLQQHLRDQQYEVDVGCAPNEALPKVVAFTGYPNFAQATTCAEYMQRTWPLTGPQVLGFIAQLASPETPPQFQITLRDETILSRVESEGGDAVMLSVFGNPYSIAEIGQQLAWLAGALRTSPFDHGVAFSTPSLSVLGSIGTSEDVWFSITYDPVVANPLVGDGCCWHSMFRNPVVISGFPIPHRPESLGESSGLELSFDIMAAVMKSTRLVDFCGTTFLKGFSSMLAAVKASTDVVLWHHSCNSEGKYISCSDL